MRKHYLVTGGILLALILAFTVYCFNIPVSKVEYVRNPDSYMAKIEKMTGTDLHVMELNEGDVLSVCFETYKGELYLKITGPDGQSFYEGNGKGVSDFKLNVKIDGSYSISLVAKRAKGYIDIHSCLKMDLFGSIFKHVFFNTCGKQKQDKIIIYGNGQRL